MRTILILLSFFMTSQAFATRRVMLISWDGLRPDFLTSDKYQTPNLRKLLKSGAYSLDLSPIDPSVTYPNHTTMVTGVLPAEHGILSNTVFDNKKGPTPMWYWESDKIKTDTLWTEAFKKGMTTSMFGWPATVGARATYLFPEIFTVKGMKETNEELIRSKTDQKILKEIEEHLKQRIPTDNELAHDQWVTKAAVYLEKEKHPDLQLVHLVNVDHWQHESGVDSKETKEAVDEMDRELGQLLSASNDPNLCTIVLGDHGHADYKKIVNINVILKNHGFINLNKLNEIDSWKAVAHVSGAQGAVYVKKKSDRKIIKKLLDKELKNHFKILSKKEMDKMKIYPDADFGLFPKVGYSLSGAFKEIEREDQSLPRSNHGNLASAPEMRTVFLAKGCGIKARNLGKMSMLQVAPTVGKLLGLKLKVAKEKPLEL